MVIGFCAVPRRKTRRPNILLKGVISWGAVLASLLNPSFLAFSLSGIPPGNKDGLHKIEVRDMGWAMGPTILGADGRLIADYGAFQLYVAKSFSADLTTNSQVRFRDEYNTIFLNAVRLDTTKSEVQTLRKTIGSFQGRRLHLVHYAGPILPSWRSELIGCGVQIVAYVPHNAYLVYGDATSLASVQALAENTPRIQWDGPYLDSYRIHPKALAPRSAKHERQSEIYEFAIQLVADANANPDTLDLLDKLKLGPIERLEHVLNYVNVVVRLSQENLKDVAARPDVVSIQPYLTPKKLCERQAQIVAGNLSSGGLLTGPGYLAWLASKGFTQAQFEASGFVVDVSDSGIDNGTTTPGHFGLYAQGTVGGLSRVVYARLEGTRSSGSTLAGCDGHGTLNAHLMGGFDDLDGFPFSDAEGYHYGLGVCPFVKMGSSVIFDPDSFTSPNFNNLQSRAFQAGARISNNSWGSAVWGEYDINAQNFDALVRDAQPNGSVNANAAIQEMVDVFAVGNEGPNQQSINSPATAKNVISVGAGENQQGIGGTDGSGIGDDQADDANDVIAFSSRGPCADMRHKPDLMAPGTHVSGGVAEESDPGVTGTALACYNGTGVSGGVGNLFFPPGQQFFTTSSGTSHATPCVSGGCALVRQYFLNNFSNPPSPAMTKAFLINSARYMTGLNANDTLWSDNQGMGEMNLGMAFDGAQRLLRDQLDTDLFTASGQVRVFKGTVVDTNKPFRATLAWTDAPGSTTGAAYNNDLDLTVTIGGNTYNGNVFDGAFSTTGGSPDTMNNVESVFLPPGTAGTFVVTVTAVDINSDGVPGNAFSLDQDFALVVYNAAAPAPPTVDLEPTNQTVIAGANVSFQVAADGTPPLSYQWFFNGTNLLGETSSILLLTNVEPGQMGPYWVTITNGAGWKSSSEASLKVLVPPSLFVTTANGTNAGIGLISISGLNYTLQSKNTLSDPQWVSLTPAVAGNGGPIYLVDTNSAATSRFYRVLCN